ncbi:MAG: NAD-dependent succinate-semialdehyde dehydrogenase [Paracoccaceae bacterium]
MSETMQTFDPATGRKLKSYDCLTDDQMVQAVEQCHEAFDAWRLRSVEDRGEVIRGVGTALRNRADELARLMTQEMGKTLEQSRQEIELCAAICDYTADIAPDELAPLARELPDGGDGHIVFSPIGVIYGIQPWNYPAYQVVRYSIANLMAGNGVLLKHAENVTGCGLLLDEIYREGGLPENLFKTIVITHDQSDDLIEHKLVRGVTLTGSPAAGRHVGAKAAGALKKSVLELGSNDAYVVLEDCDMDLTVEACVKGRIYNNGETCVAAKRFVVVDAVYDTFRDKFVEQMKALTLGDPTKESTDLGPMARKDLREDLHEQVEKSVANGAKVLCGGEMPEGDGYYYPATVLEDVKPGQPAYDDELFGPVASVIRARDTEDAMRIANDSRFGLGGGIFTKDTDKAVALARDHFDTGMVFVNGFGIAKPNMPFGGVKDSGYGREHGGFGLKEFVNVKAIQVIAK